MNVHLSSTLPAAIQIRETALRRRLPAELLRFGEEIEIQHLQDDISTRIFRWQELFRGELRITEDANDVRCAFVTLLKGNDRTRGILRDPVTRESLQIDALLGSDGRTYNRSTLEIFHRTVPQPYANRSPLEPNNPTPFSTRPHPLLTSLFDWLDDHEGRPRRSMQPIPQIPAVVRNTIAPAPQPATSPSVQERLNNMINRTRTQYQSIEARANAVFDQTINGLAQNRQNNALTIAEIRGRIQQEEASLAQLNQRLDDLDHQLNELGSSLNDTDYKLLVLERLVTATEKAIEDSEHTDWGAIGAVVGIGLACWFIGPMILEGFSVHAAPTAGGGMMAKGTLFF